MQGLMQSQGLMISSILTHAARHHPTGEIVSRTHENTTHRYTWRDVEARSRRLVRVLQNLGVTAGDRVGTLAWNGYRHLEVYYAAPGMAAICHTINPRLHPDDIAYIINHAEDKVLFVDLSFAPLIAAIAGKISTKTIIMLTDPANMPEVALAAGQTLACYDALMGAADEDYVWPSFDENTASALCYTSGTTGRPKGVLYSHRSTWLHAYATALPDVLAIRSTSRVLPVVPMFHVNAWGMPYAAALTAWLQANTGILPRSLALDGKSVGDGKCGMIVTLCRHEDGRPVAMIPATGKKEDCEVSEARALLADPAVSLENALVTADPLHNKEATLRVIVEQGGDYLVGTKPNTAKRLDAVQTALKGSPFLN